ncbi:MAG: phenylacetate-CoA oxygenase subunit PaaI [Chloroflexota bacterium]|nr:phenylacetate-CoA oxygenase subunit PaaI [Chloroflexota bacterium]
MNEQRTFRGPADLDRDSRQAFVDLIRAVADSKVVLGRRYAEWANSAPVLESGVAAAAMAQAELGHTRALYMLLREFDEVPAEITDDEQFRDSYNAPAFLDEPLPAWTDFVTVNLIFDGAMAELIKAMRGSAYEPLAQRTDKMLEEERFHQMHGRDWFRRLAKQSDAAREALQEAVNRVWPETLCWFGRDEDEGARALARDGILGATPMELRDALLNRIGPILEQAGISQPDAASLAWDRYDPKTRRVEPAA